MAVQLPGSMHFPPDGTEWAAGYDVKDMIF